MRSHGTKKVNRTFCDEDFLNLSRTHKNFQNKDVQRLETDEYGIKKMIVIFS